MNVPKIARCSLLVIAAAGLAPAVRATSAAELLAAYTAQAGSPASPERGERLFTTHFKNDFGWSCASCHGAVPTTAGKHAVTEKPIAPLAPAANPARFSDRTKVESQFRLNCKDVVGRECTPAEKADVLSWLLTLKP